MPKISINGQEYEYLESTIIELVEGLIGLPSLRRAVLVQDPEFSPFYWFASLDDPKSRFIVAEVGLVFQSVDYREYLETAFNGDKYSKDTVVLALVNVSSDWKKTTFNLRAPILLNPHTQQAAQVILSNSEFRLAESLPS